jgi:acetyl-CoA carboxylase biotin carboxylase subunit
MIESVLVANRGEIARRIIRSAKRLGVRAIAVYSEADADLPFVAEADEAVLIGPANPAQSYRNTEAILDAARKTAPARSTPDTGSSPRTRLSRRPSSTRGWCGSGRRRPRSRPWATRSTRAT